jgi:hypothetical protein
MKRVALLALLALGLTPSLAHAFPFYTLLHILPRPPASEGEAERVARAPRPVSSVDFVLSTFDKPIIDSFREAWQRAANGMSPRESVVLILKMADGGYSARMPNPTNEYKSFTFAWHPATIAILHTHPNNSHPRPEDGDITAADKFKVPVFTLTLQGMFVYDPATRKITKVCDGLAWRDAAVWEKIHARLASQEPRSRP